MTSSHLTLSDLERSNTRSLTFHCCVNTSRAKKDKKATSKILPSK